MLGAIDNIASANTFAIVSTFAPVGTDVNIEMKVIRTLGLPMAIDV